MDEKTNRCMSFVLERIQRHREQFRLQNKQPPPFFLGINGVQGAGKTTLVSNLFQILSAAPHHLSVLVMSIDDLYLSRSQQAALAQANPSNPLVQHRGQPSTHDIPLLRSLFRALANGRKDVRVPKYDKSAFSGHGDRVPETEWQVVNSSGRHVELVVLEGWCVGFRALGEDQVRIKWETARQFQETSKDYHGQLARQALDSVLFVDRALKDYDETTDMLDGLIHIDAEDTLYVYQWRQEQEKKLRNEKGAGMTDEQVISFVDGYYPAYELYLDVLRQGIFHHDTGKQLRLVIGRDRNVKNAMRI